MNVAYENWIASTPRLKGDEVVALRRQIPTRAARASTEQPAALRDTTKLHGKQLLVYAGGDGSDRKCSETLGYDVTTFDISPKDSADYIGDGIIYHSRTNSLRSSLR